MTMFPLTPILCDTPFWNRTLLWDGVWPQFTLCFQETVLVWVPCGWLVFASVYYISVLVVYYPVKPLVHSKQFVSKLVLYSLFFALAVGELVLQVEECDKDDIVPMASILAPALMACILVLACILTIMEQVRGFITSGVLFVFWILRLVLDIVPLYTFAILGHGSTGVKAGLFYLRFVVTFLIVFVHCFAEKSQIPEGSTKAPCPETQASFLSRLTFWWANQLLLQGYKSPLTEHSMTDLNPRDKSCNVVPRFLKRWTIELEQARERRLQSSSEEDVNLNDNTAAHPEKDTPDPATAHRRGSTRRTSIVRLPPAVIMDDSTDTMVLSNDGRPSPVLKAKEAQGPQASLRKILLRTFGGQLLSCQIWKVFYDALLLANPLVLGELVKFIETHDRHAWKGYVYSSVLFLFMQLQSLFFHQLFHYSTSISIHIRTSLISAIFRKSLTMSNESRKSSTVGEVVNLMSVDVENVQKMIPLLWTVWSCPLQITVALYLLYKTVGAAMVAGLVVMIVVFPFNGFIMTKLNGLMNNILLQKDQRMKLISEVLNGMKILKLYAWEQSFLQQINDVRQKELTILVRYSLWSACMMICWSITPYAVSLFTFLTYIFTVERHFLNPRVAFVSISLFAILRFAISIAPVALTNIIQAVISLRRINAFLTCSDLEPDCVQRADSMDESEYAITVKNGVFKWTVDGPPSLRMNLQIKAGSLVAVVGRVGSGKSSLISALIGDMHKAAGQVAIEGSMAYVPQQAWIQNNTVRNNILFGEPMNQELYDNCLSACALKSDLEVLAAGDLTEIGERGINLSGGQKQRISLARAMYSKSDVFLLDDPMSAVDSNVGKHIFEKVISKKGWLARKTRVLVTHGVQWLPQVDQVIVIRYGVVSEMGTYEQLLSHKGPFAVFLNTYLQETGMAKADPTVQEMTERVRAISVIDESSLSESNNSSTEGYEEDTSDLEEEAEEQLESESDSDGILIEEETVETGRVKLEVYKEYARDLGFPYVVVILLQYCLYQTASVLSNVFLSKWTDNKDLADLTKLPGNSSARRDLNNYYLGLYGGIGAVQIVFMLIYSILQSLRSVHASHILHKKMLARIFHAPMSFFDTTPTGRIINRFSQDITTIDMELPMTVFMGLDSASIVFSTLIVISYSTPYFLVATVPLGSLYIFIQQFYIPTSRQLKRLEAKTRSPIYNYFSETLAGASVIRAFRKGPSFIQESERRVDANQIYHFSNFTANRWLGFRLEFLGNVVVLLASAVAVALRTSLSGGVVGLSVSYALEVTGNLNMLVRMISNLETQVVSVERVKEYTKIKSEAPWKQPDCSPPESWPQRGKIAMRDVSLRYRDDLDLVLKDVSFTIKPGEKIGVVGRTGAGKSSLMLALFRLFEADKGEILLDGVDISTLGLHDLRINITILPQEPVMFAVPLRMNIDPFGRYSDDQVWQALEQAHLKKFVATLPETLQHKCGEGGENLSMGQRQLVCLARSLLHKTKVLILDEATAAVDMETDDLIQETIRTKFKDCTVLTIAHRINTIMDYDRILVLDKGQVAEFDTVANLLAREDSIFFNMAKTAGLASRPVGLTPTRRPV